MKKRLISTVQCIKSILANFSVIGFGIAAFDQEIWPAFPLAASAAILAIILAWMVPNG